LIVSDYFVYSGDRVVDFIFFDHEEIYIPAGFIGPGYFSYPRVVVLDQSFDCESFCVVIHDREDERGG
jgi:hypothetical protein